MFKFAETCTSSKCSNLQRYFTPFLQLCTLPETCTSSKCSSLLRLVLPSLQGIVYNHWTATVEWNGGIEACSSTCLISHAKDWCMNMLNL